MVHQSNAYFERCHAADFDPTVRPELRRECWARWLQHYTQGQPPDRVDYARGRVAALEDGEDIAPLPGMQRTALGSSYTASFLTMEEQAQSEAETSDPEVELPADTQEALEPAVAEIPAPPDVTGGCAPVCTPRWNDCMSQCDGRAASCREACETEHRTCMRGCY